MVVAVDDFAEADLASRRFGEYERVKGQQQFVVLAEFVREDEADGDELRLACPGLCEGARSTAWTSDSRIQIFILAETATLTARRHLAAFRFSSVGETATAFFGVSQIIRSISLTR